MHADTHDGACPHTMHADTTHAHVQGMPTGARKSACPCVCLPDRTCVYACPPACVLAFFRARCVHSAFLHANFLPAALVHTRLWCVQHGSVPAAFVPAASAHAAFLCATFLPAALVLHHFGACSMGLCLPH
eukprot:354306-Chlamydomonas_euryale.AAC.3